MIEITSKLKKRFCKDNGISLQIFESPYFEERLELFDFTTMWNEFIEFITKNFETTDAYFDYCYSLENKIINYIKESEAFKALNSDNMLKYPHGSIHQRDAYKDMCVGKRFVSIDMCKANFSTLVFYGKTNGLEFHDSYDYVSFIKRFTEFDYFAKSKQLRQVIFGNCNSKRITTYQSYFMFMILNTLVNTNTGVTLDDVYGLNSDEIILQIDDQNIIDKIANLVNTDELSPIPLKMEVYKIGKFKGTNAYVKLFDDESYELKCINPYEAPFIYRYMMKQPYTDSDMYFMFEKKLAKLVEAPTIELIKTNDVG